MLRTFHRLVTSTGIIQNPHLVWARVLDTLRISGLTYSLYWNTSRRLTSLRLTPQKSASKTIIKALQSWKKRWKFFRRKHKHFSHNNSSKIWCEKLCCVLLMMIWRIYTWCTKCKRSFVIDILGPLNTLLSNIKSSSVKIAQHNTIHDQIFCTI